MVENPIQLDTRMTEQQRRYYINLSKKLNTAYAKLFNHDTHTRIPMSNPKTYNAHLHSMKIFLQSVYEDPSRNKYFKNKPLL